MTSAEKRKAVANIMLGWVGGRQGGATHREILETYNEYAAKHGMARAHESYAWCAETASAAYIKAGLADLVPIGLSCGDIRQRAKNRGIYKENDGFVPSVADEVIFGWRRPSGDNQDHDHVGIVVSVSKDKKYFWTVEGNAGSPSQVRKIKRAVGSLEISGFVHPNFTSDKKEVSKPAAQKPAAGTIKIAKDAESYTVQKGDTLSEIAKAAGTTVEKLQEINGIKNANLIRSGQVIRLKASKYKRSWTVTAEIGLNIRKEPVDGVILKAMPFRARCTCDGQSKKVNGVVWLHVTYGNVTGWSSSEYLK